MAGPHSLNSVREESAESSRNTLGEVGSHDPFPSELTRVDCREQKCESLSKASFGGVEQHSAGDRLAVRLNEGRTERAETPQHECCADGFFGAPSAGSQDPWDLEYDGADARQGLDVAELTAFESDVFIKAEDTSVSELTMISYCSILAMRILTLFRSRVDMTR